MTDLYRHFSASDELLYIGISMSAFARLRAHSSSSWIADIARMQIESFPTRAAARTAERLAIRAERPRYNIMDGAFIEARVPAVRHPMESLRLYINSLDPAAQIAFASRCGTTIGYLRKATSKRQRLDAQLAISIERESGGVVRCDDLRPDLDWQYLAAHPRDALTDGA